MRRKRLNVTRRAGRLYFRRETKRLSDGTPDGEVLWVYSNLEKPRRCVFAEVFVFPMSHERSICYYANNYHIKKPVQAAKAMREYLKD